MTTSPHSMDPSTLLPLPPATSHILLALAAGDQHGYGVIQDVEARTVKSRSLCKTRSGAPRLSR